MTIPRFFFLIQVACAAALMAVSSTVAGEKESAAVITFATEPGELYLPVAEVSRALRLPVLLNIAGQCIQINGMEVAAGSLRCLNDGTELIGASGLVKAGVDARSLGRIFGAGAEPKRVEINLGTQQIFAWQGSRLVLQSHISSGRNGRTPAGDFRAGPFRARMHYSTRYHNAPMPWSVQINGHVFIHGFTSVPNYPASHGCIRLPLTGHNPARFFFEWVDNGTPVQITRD